ncbi:MAG: M23 family metallopeptidase [Saprospiraceae bacterium]|nr:M23 family metallopeptidase [Saprospiraceae bacterium]
MKISILFSQTAIFCLLLLAACKEDDGIGDVVSDFSCITPASNDYALPFPVGTSYKLIQGTCSSFDHNTNARYAFDFAMPVGSAITAAADGEVISIEDRFADSDRARQNINYIVVEHPNLTFGRYLHVKSAGALVNLGSQVSRGDTIGYSGSAGSQQGPMLHFDVINCLGSCVQFETFSIGFFNSEPPLTNQTRDYLAVPY